MEVSMNKNVIKILQGSVVTQTVLGGLTISTSCNARNYESWLAMAVDKVIAIIGCHFYGRMF